MKIIPAIMSGGSGTRLWPLSTAERPKQFQNIGTDHPMIIETMARLQGEFDGVRFLDPMVLCSAVHADLAVEQMERAGVTPSSIVLEPMGRNTAATAALAALAAAEIDPEASVLLLPADHLIEDSEAFRAVVARAAPLARDHIVTFGMEPTGPETGYGYIQAGAEVAPGVLAVAAFKEKPERALAQSYLDKGGFYWNGGIFLYAPALMLEEFAASPEILKTTRAAFAAASKMGVVTHIPAELFALVPSKPVDVAVMEKTRRAAVAPCQIGWRDVGSWDEVWAVTAKDDQGNAMKGPVSAFDVHGCLIRSEGLRVAALGVEDLVIVATDDAVLVLPRERAQEVKKLWEMIFPR